MNSNEEVVGREGEPSVQSSSRLRVFGFMAVALAVALFVGLGGDRPLRRRITAPGEPPSLFAQPPGCAGDKDLVIRTAEDALQAASAKAERYPFAPRDGVRAVMLYREARSCFQAIGDRGRAHEVERTLRRLEARVEADYAMHRLRLSRALEREKNEDALVATQALLALLESESDYRSRLAELERRLIVALEAKAIVRRKR